jgi:hypothetical protein
MNIKLPHMPYRFDSPDGRMEITVRGKPAITAAGESPQQFGAAVTFLQPGPLALKRIPLSAQAASHSGVMRVLVEGFKVTPASHDKDSIEFRVLTALTTATGVVDLNG